jgi:large subunit ribosomal protein L10
MTRTRSQKDHLVEEIRQVFALANNLFLVSLSGLASNDVNQLRAALRKRGAKVRVVKNRLARRAAADSTVSKLDASFRGPTAVVYHATDPAGTAKGLVEFAKDHPQLELRAGLLDRTQTVLGAEVKAVADMPTQDQIRATLLALINTPATMIVRLLATPGTQIARAVGEYGRKQGGGEPAPAEGA